MEIDETDNHMISECNKRLQKEYKTRDMTGWEWGSTGN